MSKSIEHKKGLLREAMKTALVRYTTKLSASEDVSRWLTKMEEFRSASSVAFFVGRSDEVCTTPILETTLAMGKRVAVPFCQNEKLVLVWVKHVNELAPGAYGILEPLPPLRGERERMADVAQVDIVLVPGLAFTNSGHRLGRGKGYYDRLLSLAGPCCSLIGLAFECQIVPDIPCLEHDIRMHYVVTEQAVYHSRD